MKFVSKELAFARGSAYVYVCYRNNKYPMSFSKAQSQIFLNDISGLAVKAY